MSEGDTSDSDDGTILKLNRFSAVAKTPSLDEVISTQQTIPQYQRYNDRRNILNSDATSPPTRKASFPNHLRRGTSKGSFVLPNSENTPLVSKLAYGKARERKKLLKQDNGGWFIWVRVLWNYDDERGV